MKIKTFVLIAILCSLLISCSVKSEIIGLWELENNPEEMIEFYKDGTVQMYSRTGVIAGTYTFVDNNDVKVEFSGLLHGIVGAQVYEVEIKKEKLILSQRNITTIYLRGEKKSPVIIGSNGFEEETTPTKDSQIKQTEIIGPEPTIALEVNDGNKLFVTEFFDLVVSDDKEAASKFACQCMYGDECYYAIEMINQDFDWKNANLELIELKGSFIVPEYPSQNGANGIAGMDVYTYILTISKDTNIVSYPIVLYTSKDSFTRCIDIDG